jgi:dihydrofolate synthase/folylpolyglutamate synthase
VEAHAAGRGGAVRHLDREIRIGAVAVDRTGTSFELQLPGGRVEPLRTRLVGRHQARNAALAVWASSFLPAGLRPGPQAIAEGLAAVRWPARFECCGEAPLAVWDAGHNPEGMGALVSTFAEVFPGRRAVVIAGFSADKELEPMIRPLSSLAERLVVTRSTHWRAAEPAAVVERWRELELPGEPIAVSEPRAALEMAAPWARASGLALVTGSIYLLGELIPLAGDAGMPAPVV